MGVAAADATTATVKSVEWTGNDTVIKVDLGEKLIAPTLSATVTLDQAVDCKDTNGDGLVDTDLIFLNTDVNAEQGWMYTNTKYWPSTKTAMYYIGLGSGSVTGGRFLAPGQEENEGTYANQLSHTHYEDEEAAFKYLVDEGAVEVIYDEDGELETVLVKTAGINYKAAGQGAGSSLSKGEIAIALSVKSNKAKALTSIYEDVVNFYESGSADWNSSYYDVTYLKTTTVNNSSGSKYATYNVNEDDEEVAEYTFTGSSAGKIVLVKSVKGGYEVVGVDTYAPTKFGYTASTEDGENGLSYKDVTKLSSKKLLVKDGTATSTDLVFSNENITTVAKGDNDVYAYWWKLGTTIWAKEDTEKLDAIALESTDGGAVKKYTLVDYANGNVYATVAGNKVKVTSKNAEDYFTGSNLAAGNLWVDDVNLTDSALVNGDAISYYGLVDKEYTHTDGEYGYTYAKVDYDTYYIEYQDPYGSDEFIAKENASFALAVKDATTYTEDANGNKIVDELNWYDNWNYATKLGSFKKITFVDVTDCEKDDDTYEGAVKLSSVDISKVYTYSTEGQYKLNLETLEFEWVTTYTELTEDELASDTLLTSDPDGKDETYFTSNMPHSYGLFYLQTPENDTEYYVLCDTADSLIERIDAAYNYAKETATVDMPDGTEYSTHAVQLEKNGPWYLAFESEEALVDFVTKYTGISTLSGSTGDKKSDFYSWYETAVLDTYNPLMGSKVFGATLPTDGITDVAHASSKACDYTVSSTSDKVTVAVTGTVDTNEPGVHDLEYSATYEGKVVGTTSIKVVVAPKYERVYEGGKVKRLTSYYVNEPTAKYAVYEYDWTNMTATVTYYEVDGSVNDTVTISL